MNRPRLIDLHCDWLLQYAAETTVFDPEFYAGREGRLAQAEGYLQGASAAVLACYRDAREWARRPDPWQALVELVTRIEAEFAGRLLIGPEDHARWRDDPGSLCWGVIGVEGFDALVRGPADLERLPGLFGRGVRVFQPVYQADNALAGSATPGDDRGLTDLGRSFLGALAGLGAHAGGPRPVVDLAHMNPAAASETLDWFEADGTRAGRVVPVYSHGALQLDGFAVPRAITPGNLGRLRALGGVVGFTPSFYATPDALRAGIETAAALPYLGRPGYEGIALGTDFLGVNQTLPGLGNAEEVIGWVFSAFDPETAAALADGNGRKLLGRLAGVP